jgi:hypothetical protein
VLGYHEPTVGAELIPALLLRNKAKTIILALAYGVLKIDIASGIFGLTKYILDRLCFKNLLTHPTKM